MQFTTSYLSNMTLFSPIMMVFCQTAEPQSWLFCCDNLNYDKKSGIFLFFACRQWYGIAVKLFDIKS
jgi:hypothetical protein